MGYFDTEQNVKEYIRLADGYDGRALIGRLNEFLKSGSTVLELGMGPGKDLDRLAETYKVTGSDLSDVFLRLYRDRHPQADLVKLDAVSIDIDRSFDCIYSNKVLHHLSTEHLKRSFDKQWELLHDRGLILHTFWKGEGVETVGDLKFVYYTEDDIRNMVKRGYEILLLETYTEMENEDSILLIAEKKVS